MRAMLRVRCRLPSLAGRVLRREGPGFTLVELLVVLAIISALTAMLLPALGAVRRQARALVNTSNMKQITTAVGVFACGNDGIYPPSVATIGTDDIWNWQAPTMLTAYHKRAPKVHRSVSAYLKPYIDDAEVLFCPNAPLKYRCLRQAWHAGDAWDHPETETVPDAVFGTYCLLWNYVGYLGEEKGLFRGPSGPERGYRASSIVVSDYFGYDHWRSRLAFGSCEPFADAGIADGTAVSSAFWSQPAGGTLAERRRLSVRLRAGYVDGHVESYTPSETQAMYVIVDPATNTPYTPGTGPGTFYLPRAGLR